MAEKNDKDEKKPPLNNYMRYSGLGFQIAGSIAMGVLLGWLLDKKVFHTQQPYFMLACSFLFLIAGMYLAFRDFLKK